MFKKTTKYGDRKFGGGKFDRAPRRGGRDFGGDARPELFPATCATCGEACKVPFRTDDGRPAYCRDCFRQASDSWHGRSEDRRFSKPSFNKPSFGKPAFGEKPLFRTTCESCHSSCEVPFRPNGSKPVYCRDCFGKRGDAPRSDAPRAPRRETTNDDARWAEVHAKLDRIVRELAALKGGGELEN